MFLVETKLDRFMLLYSTNDFYSLWTYLWTLTLYFRKYTAPVKQPISFFPLYNVCIKKSQVVVLHYCFYAPTYYYILTFFILNENAAKLIRVFFPRWKSSDRTHSCSFTEWQAKTVGTWLIHSFTSAINWQRTRCLKNLIVRSAVYQNFYILRYIHILGTGKESPSIHNSYTESSWRLCLC